jgi:hypothetical protein
MSRNRNRRKPQRRAENSDVDQNRPTNLMNFISIVWQLIKQLKKWLALFGVTTLISYVIWFYNTVAPPEIHASPGQVNSPFDLRFLVQNKSWLLTVTDFDLLCRIDHIKTANNNTFSNNTVKVQGDSFEVPPSEHANYNCPFENSFKIDDQIIFAQITIYGSYKMIGFTRTSNSKTLTWSQRSGVWYEGELIN